MLLTSFLWLGVHVPLNLGLTAAAAAAAKTDLGVCCLLVACKQAGTMGVSPVGVVSVVVVVGLALLQASTFLEIED